MVLSAKIAYLNHTSLTRFSAMLLVAILGLIVQMQITPELGGTKVRLNLADPIIAMLMPLILYVALRNWRDVNKELGWHILTLFVFATAVFSYAYINGFSKIGFFAWSAVKYAGWYALMAYLAAGVFCTFLLGKTGQRIFALVFFGACVFSSLIQILNLYFSKSHGYFSLTRLEGFTGNPNAFGFVLICGFVLGVTHKEAISSRFSKGSTELLGAVVLAGIYFTGSISSLLTTIFCFVYFVDRVRIVETTCRYTEYSACYHPYPRRIRHHQFRLHHNRPREKGSF